MQEDEAKNTSIGVSTELKNRLLELGNMGDSYEDVILRLIANDKVHNLFIDEFNLRTKYDRFCIENQKVKKGVPKQ